MNLTQQQRNEIYELSLMSDEDIDYSDIPALTDEQLNHANWRKFHQPKVRLSSKLDADIVIWIKKHGKISAFINSVLREKMIEETHANQQNTLNYPKR